MKLLISILLSLFIIGCVTSDSSYQQTTTNRIYDEDGHLVGKIRHNKYESRVYDKDGKLLYKLK